MTDRKLILLIVAALVLVLGTIVVRNWPQSSEEGFASPMQEKSSLEPKRSILVKAVLSECNKPAPKQLPRVILLMLVMLTCIMSLLN